MTMERIVRIMLAAAFLLGLLLPCAGNSFAQSTFNLKDLFDVLLAPPGEAPQKAGEERPGTAPAASAAPGWRQVARDQNRTVSYEFPSERTQYYALKDGTLIFSTRLLSALSPQAKRDMLDRLRGEVDTKVLERLQGQMAGYLQVTDINCTRRTIQNLQECIVDNSKKCILYTKADTEPVYPQRKTWSADLYNQVCESKVRDVPVKTLPNTPFEAKVSEEGWRYLKWGMDFVEVKKAIESHSDGVSLTVERKSCETTPHFFLDTAANQYPPCRQVSRNLELISLNAAGPGTTQMASAPALFGLLYRGKFFGRILVLDLTDKDVREEAFQTLKERYPGLDASHSWRGGGVKIRYVSKETIVETFPAPLGDVRTHILIQSTEARKEIEREYLSPVDSEKERKRRELRDNL
jgi:hypothetical protein